MPGPWKGVKRKYWGARYQTAMPPASTMLGKVLCHAAIAA